MTETKGKRPGRGAKAPRRAAQPDWAAIFESYALGEATVTDICARYGIARSRLYRHARQAGWTARRPRQAATLGTSRDRISRLFAALDQQMADVERRLAEAQGKGTSKSGDRERDARTLATLARTLEKLNQMIPATDDTEDNDQPPDDIDAFRQELARRLVELRERSGD